MIKNGIIDNSVFKVGIYERLSREDGDDLESESILNQREILYKYVLDNRFTLVEEYVDDGWSGGNFNRPGFQQLIKDIERGKINCVITKDLSRLGRDHIDTGRYVERYFPENNIRYIAINDDIDTFFESSGIDMMPFRLSMNDMYAKDISKKVRSSLLTMKVQGKFCGSRAPYGYMKDANDKHKLVPNPETAHIVQKIFELYTSGCGSSAIAHLLTMEKVPTPITYKMDISKLRKDTHPEIWTEKSVNNILKNKEYTGCLVQHTSQNISYKTQKRRRLPKSEWCVVENTHEPLIDLDTYLLAQTMRNKSDTYKKDRRNVEYTLANLVYCKDCGAKMCINYDKKRDRVIMNCGSYRKYSKYGICFSHFINYDKLEKTIYQKLRELSCQYMNDKEEFERIIKKEFVDPKEVLKDKIEKARKEIDALRRKQDALYDDKFNNIIDAETYKRLYDQTSKNIEKSNETIMLYEQELSSIREECDSYRDSISIIESYLKIDHPTNEMIHKIIDKIYITKDKTVEIHYKIRKELVAV